MSLVLSSRNDGPLPLVDGRLKGSIVPFTTCELSRGIRDDFSMVTMAIASQLQKEGKDISSDYPINCFFIPSGHLDIELLPNEHAVCMRLAVYRVASLEGARTKPVRWMLLAEELCHLIWGIRDERLINDKVLEVLQNIIPELTTDDLGYRSIPAEAPQPSSMDSPV